MKGARPLTDAEIASIKAYYDNLVAAYPNLREISRHKLLIIRDRLLFFLGLMTGFRIAELCSMKWKQLFNFKRNKIKESVRVPKENMKKKLADRSVFIPRSIHAYIHDLMNVWPDLHLKKLEREDFIFSGLHENETQEPHISTFHRRLDRLFRVALKIDDPATDKLSSHSMRKTFVNYIRDLCNDPYTIMKYSGHRDVRSTASYIAAKETDKIDEMLKNR